MAKIEDIDDNVHNLVAQVLGEELKGTIREVLGAQLRRMIRDAWKDGYDKGCANFYEANTPEYIHQEWKQSKTCKDMEKIK